MYKLSPVALPQFCNIQRSTAGLDIMALRELLYTPSSSEVVVPAAGAGTRCLHTAPPPGTKKTAAIPSTPLPLLEQDEAVCTSPVPPLEQELDIPSKQQECFLHLPSAPLPGAKTGCCPIPSPPLPLLDQEEAVCNPPVTAFEQELDIPSELAIPKDTKRLSEVSILKAHIQYLLE